MVKHLELLKQHLIYPIFKNNGLALKVKREHMDSINLIKI